MSERVALVTGGGNGIGRATVLRLAADGFAVVIADVNDANAAATAKLVDDGRAQTVHADVSVEADVAAAVACAVERFGRLDCIVNNAGVGGAFGPVQELGADDWDYTFGVLMRGVFLGTKHAVRAFDAQGGGGVIVNMASIAGVSGAATSQAYAAAKAGVVNFTCNTAVELAPRRVRVNAVAPGPVLTELTAGGAARLERTKEKLRTTQPWPDYGTAEDVANVVAFLAGSDARFVTGQTIIVDGGLLSSGGRAELGRLGDPIAKRVVGVDHGTTGVKGTFSALDPPQDKS